MVCSTSEQSGRIRQLKSGRFFFLLLEIAEGKFVLLWAVEFGHSEARQDFLKLGVHSTIYLIHHSSGQVLLLRGYLGSKKNPHNR